MNVVGAGLRPAPTGHAPTGHAATEPAPTGTRHGVPEIVRAFKAFSARRMNEMRGTPGPVWQRNYYEHVIRDETEWNRIREYIRDNPLNWAQDRENPNGETIQE